MAGLCFHTTPHPEVAEDISNLVGERVEEPDVYGLVS